MMRTLLVAAVLFVLPAGGALAQSDETVSPERFAELAQRYHALLARRPAKGTAFDRLYQQYLDAGRLDDLTAHYEALAQADPQDAAARLVLAMVHDRRGQIDEAIAAYEAAAQLAPDDFHADYYRGLLLQRTHRDREAIAALAQALRHDPPRTERLDLSKKLGRLHLRQGETAEALRVWSELAAQFPDDRFIIQDLAELLAEEEQFDEAIRRYEQLADISKGDLYQRLVARVDIGQIQARQGKRQTAIATFEECLDSVRPDSWNADDIRRRIEETFLRSDDLTGLADYYRTRLKNHPDDLASMVRLAGTFARLGNSAAAINHYQQALKLAPTRHDIRQQLIGELVRDGQWAAAVAQAETLVEQSPGDVEALRLLGQLNLQAAGDDRKAAEDKALAAWRKIAALRPDDALLAVQLAELCREAAGIGSRLGTGDEADRFQAKGESRLGQEALGAYREAVRRAPTVPQYHEYLGEYLFSIGRTDDALAAWRRLAEPPHDSPANLKRLAEILARAEWLDDALAALRQALDKEPRSYDLHALAADLQSRNGDLDAALKHVAALERLADSPVLEEQALTHRVELYLESDRLAAEFDALRARLDTDKATARDFWLAGLMAAARRQSTQAIRFLQEALKRQPDDPRLLRLQAEIRQQAGDLTGAAEQYRRLVALEPRNRTAHLRQVVQLELDLGHIDEARAAAEDLLRLSPGRPESVELLADVLLRIGKADEALDVLRRAVRSDPRNVDLRLALAVRLAQQQRTAEAVEHYWRCFDLLDDLAGKLNIIGALADQHLVAGTFPQLVERLEQRRRGQEDPRETTLCLAEAFTRAEDYVAARRELSGLLARRGDDVAVLTQLVTLSERLDDTAEAAEYQEKIVALTPAPQQLEHLARLYGALDRTDEAAALWQRLVREAADDTTLLAAADRATSVGDHAQAIALLAPEWTRRPDDWRFGYRLALAYRRTKDHARAAETARALLRLLPSDKYEPKPTATRTPTPPRSSPPPLVERLSLMFQLRSFVAPRARSSYVSAPKLETLRDAQMLAAVLLADVLKADGTREAWLDQLRKQAAADDVRAVRQLCWVHLPEGGHAELEPLLRRWIAQSPDDPEPRLLLAMLPFYTEPRAAGLANEAQLNTMREQYEWFLAHHPDVGAYLANIYVRQLIAMDHRDEARRLTRAALAAARDPDDIVQIAQGVQQLQDLDLIEDLIERWNVLRQAAPSKSSATAVAYLVARALPSLAQSKDHEGLLRLFDKYMTITHPATLRATGSLSARSGMPAAVYHTAGTVMIARTLTNSSRQQPEFPASSAWLEADRLQMVVVVHQVFAAAHESQRLAALVDRRIAETDGVANQCWTMTRIVLLWLDEQRPEAAARMEKLVAAAPGQTELRLLQARLLTELREEAKALAALDGLVVPFGPAARDVEQLRMRLALKTGDNEAAKQAALRLLGMRLSSPEQAELARVLKQLGLDEQSADLLRRATKTAGSNVAQLHQLMQQSQASDPKRAAEIARIIIRRVGRTRTGNDAQFRREALRLLKSSGDLRTMIEQTERQLAAAPQSLKLLEDLAEFYTAEGNEPKTLAVYERIIAARPDDADAHFRIAQALFRHQKSTEGVARLEAVWKHNPDLILQQYQEITRHYDTARKLGLLAEHLRALKKQGTPVQNGWAVMQMTNDLAQRAADVDGMIAVWRAAIEVVPDQYRGNVVQQCGSYLLRQKRPDEAWAIYRDMLLPADGTGESVAAYSMTTQTNAGMFIRSPLMEFADLTRDLKKGDELEVALRTVQPAQQPIADLLRAMLRRRQQDEEPLTRLGRRALEDETVAAAMRPYRETLKEELAVCEGRPALEAAIAFWTASPSLGMRSSHDQEVYALTRVAGLWIKLGDRIQARAVLLDALHIPVTMPGYSPNQLDQQRIAMRLPAAEALRTHGFHLDAAQAFGEILALPIETLDERSYVRQTQIPLARQSLHECLAKILTADEIAAAAKSLRAELEADAPQLARFFVVVDPSPPGERSVRRQPSTRRTVSIAVLPGGATVTTTETASVEVNGPPLASPDVQLLPALLRKLREEGEWPQLTAAVARHRKNAADGPEPLRDQLRCLQTLMTLMGDQPADAVPVLETWRQRTADTPARAAAGETWLLARTALDHTETATAGRRLMGEIVKSAGRAGNMARQQAALAALRAAGNGGDELVAQLLADPQADPRLRYQFAQLCFEQKQYDHGIDLLKSVWKHSPELAIPQLATLAKHYAEVQRLGDLADGLESVGDAQLRSRNGHTLTNLIRLVPHDEGQLDGALKLYRVACDWNDAGNRDYLDGQFAAWLRQLPPRDKTLDAWRTLVFADDGPHRRMFAEAFEPMLSTAKALGRFEVLRADCRKVIKEHPQWKPHGEFLLAMIARRDGDPQPMEDFAVAYASDPAYAAAWWNGSDGNLLRQELEQCTGKPALELALTLWQAILTATSGDPATAAGHVAELLVKLDRRDEARQTLLAAWKRPFASNTYETQSAESRIQQQVLRGRSMASQMARLGFRPEAVAVYASVAAIDTSATRTSYTRQEADRSVDEGRRLIPLVLAKDADDLLRRLQTEVARTDPPPDLDVYFALFPPGGEAAPSRTAPFSAKKPDPDTLLPALLKKAKRDQLDNLADAVAAARKRPGPLSLAALDVLIGLARKETDHAAAALADIAGRLEKNPALAADAAVCLAAREALANLATRDAARRLAEAVAIAAGQAKNRTVQETAIAALIDSFLSTGDGGQVRKLLDRLGTEGDRPDVRLQLARALFHQKQPAEAIELLAPVWSKQPRLILNRFDEFGPLYVAAGEGDRLGRDMQTVRDLKVRRDFAYDLVNAVQSRPNNGKDETPIVLLRAIAAFVPAGSNEYACRSLASQLMFRNRRAEALDVYRQAVLPPTGPTSQLSPLALQLVDVAHGLGKLPEMEAAGRKAIEAHPEWSDYGDLFVAMVRQRQGNEEALVRLAERYRSEDEIRGRLANSTSLLRSALSQCEAREALDLGLELWQSELERLRTQSGGGSEDYRSFVTAAEIQLKLEQTQKARALLKEAAAHDPGTTGDAGPYYEFRRYEQVAPKMQQAGFHLDAVGLLWKNVRQEESEIPKRYGYDSRIAAQRDLLRNSVLTLLTGNLDDTLRELETALADDKTAPVLDRFFAVVSGPWTPAEQESIPAPVRGDDPAHVQLLPALLRHARSKGRLAALADACAAAQKRHPDDRPLAALATFLAAARSDGPVPVAGLVALLKDAGVQPLSIAALGAARTPEAAQALLETARTSPVARPALIAALVRQDTPEAVRALGEILQGYEAGQRMALLAPLAQMTTPEAKALYRMERVAFDDFDGGPALKWQIRNPDPLHVSYDKRPGLLTVTTQKGGFFGTATNYKNLFLLRNPVGSGGPMEITTCIDGLRPAALAQQAGLIVWADADNYLKFTIEVGDQDTRPRCALIRETAGKAQHDYMPLGNPKRGRVWLRLAKTGNQYTCSISTDDGESFQTHGTRPWGNGNPPWVGLVAKNGNFDVPEIDAAFDSFEVRRAAGSAVPHPSDAPLSQATQRIEADPKNAAHWFHRGNLYARWQRWDKAADDFRHGLELSPDEHWHWFVAACLSLQRDDREEYKRCCRELLDRFGKNSQAHIAERVGRVCLLGPEGLDDPRPAQIIDRKLVGARPEWGFYPWLLLAKGLADYRGGRYAESLVSLDECLKRPVAAHCHIQAHLVRAMCQKKLGDPDAAREALKSATDLMDEHLAPADGQSAVETWNDWIACQVLHREAESLLKPKPAKPTP